MGQDLYSKALASKLAAKSFAQLLRKNYPDLSHEEIWEIANSLNPWQKFLMPSVYRQALVREFETGNLVTTKQKEEITMPRMTEAVANAQANLPPFVSKRVVEKGELIFCVLRYSERIGNGDYGPTYNIEVLFDPDAFYAAQNRFLAPDEEGKQLTPDGIGTISFTKDPQRERLIHQFEKLGFPLHGSKLSSIPSKIRGRKPYYTIIGTDEECPCGMSDEDVLVEDEGDALMDEYPTGNVVDSTVEALGASKRSRKSYSGVE